MPALGRSQLSPVTRLPDDPHVAFNEMFVLSTHKELRQRIALGALRGTMLRSVCWKVLLGCVPSECGLSSWPEYLSLQRRGYESLRKRYQLEPQAVADK